MLLANHGRRHNLSAQSAQDELDKDAGAKPKSSLADSAIGQAAAIITLVAAGIYGTGELSLGLKLWFMHFSWTPVIGQIPHNFIITIAVGQIILPSIAVAAIVGLLIDAVSVRHADPLRPRAYWELAGCWRWVWYAVTLASAVAIFTAAPLILLSRHRDSQQNILQPNSVIVVCCVVTVSVVPAVVIYLLRRNYNPVRRNGLWRRLWTITLITFAVVPCAIWASAALLLPHVALCGPNFYNFSSTGKPGTGFMTGRMIGTSDSQAYIAVFIWSNKTGKIVGNIINVVPLSSVELQSIGSPKFTSCQQVGILPGKAQGLR
jgi:hypothetical protein